MVSYALSKGILSFGVSLLLESVIALVFSSVLVLTDSELVIAIVVLLIAALGLAYVLQALSGYIESKIIMKHKLESILLALISLVPIYYGLTVVLFEVLVGLVPEFISFLELYILLVMLPPLFLLIMIYVLSS